jgi:hypothetical protein
MRWEEGSKVLFGQQKRNARGEGICFCDLRDFTICHSSLEHNCRVNQRVPALRYRILENRYVFSPHYNGKRTSQTKINCVFMRKCAKLKHFETNLTLFIKSENRNGERVVTLLVEINPITIPQSALMPRVQDSFVCT